jgi:Zn-dependent protease with chaperone function
LNEPEPLPSRLKIALAALALPVGLMVFYGIAHGWFNSNLVGEVVQGLAAEDAAFVRSLDLADVCHTAEADLQPFRELLEENGVCRDFWMIDTSFWLAGGLVVGTALWLGFVALLATRARALGSTLVRAWRLAWLITPAAAIAKVSVETLLVTYASFEVTVLATQSYFPKLILVVLAGGCAALWYAVRAIVTRVPLEAHESFVTHLSRAEAPELWTMVDAAAAKVGTTPPDNILVAENTSFYVTELDVLHDAGRVSGKTLMLSRPLMGEMSTTELTAIIGHELAHFSGGDTELTRELYPRHVRSAMMAQALSASLFGFSPRQLLNFLQASFLPLMREQSRLRELAADAVGAAITSPRDQASALIRVHVFSEAFDARWRAATSTPADAEGRPALVQEAMRRPLLDVAQEQLFGAVAFWPAIFSRQAPHPLDTHPPLSVRLDALSHPVDGPAAQVLVSTPLTDDQRATSILGGAEAKLAQTTLALDTRLAEVAGHDALAVRVRQADVETEEGRALLEAHFPVREWKAGGAMFWFVIGFFGLSAIGSFVGGVVLAMDGMAPFLLLFLPIALLFGWIAVATWGNHKGAVLRLDCAGITSSTWSSPVRFSDVERITWNVENDRVRLLFHLGAPAVPRARFALRRRPTQKLAVPLDYKPAQIDIANVILRYFQRGI